MQTPRQADELPQGAHRLPQGCICLKYLHLQFSVFLFHYSYLHLISLVIIWLSMLAGCLCGVFAGITNQLILKQKPKIYFRKWREFTGLHISTSLQGEHIASIPNDDLACPQSVQHS